VVIPTELSKRTKVSISGITNSTIIAYMNNLNANDFETLIELFAPDGALQPPFQKPIVGKDAILRFFKEECQNLVLLPEEIRQEFPFAPLGVS
jgi:ketosteroid isomerase-like protein